VNSETTKRFYTERTLTVYIVVVSSPLSECPSEVPPLSDTTVQTVETSTNGCLVILTCQYGFHFVEGGTSRSLIGLETNLWPRCQGNGC